MVLIFGKRQHAKGAQTNTVNQRVPQVAFFTGETFLDDLLTGNEAHEKGAQRPPLHPTLHVPVVEKSLLEPFNAEQPPPSAHQLIVVFTPANEEDLELRMTVPIADENDESPDPLEETFTLDDFIRHPWEEGAYMMRMVFVTGREVELSDLDFGEELWIIDVSQETATGFPPSVTFEAPGILEPTTLLLIESLPELEPTDEYELIPVVPGRPEPRGAEELVPTVPRVPRTVEFLTGGTESWDAEEQDESAMVETTHAPLLDRSFVDMYLTDGLEPPPLHCVYVRIRGEMGMIPPTDDLTLRITVPYAEEALGVFEVDHTMLVEAPDDAFDFRLLFTCGQSEDFGEPDVPADSRIIVVDVTDNSPQGFPNAVILEVPRIRRARKRLVLLETLPDFPISDVPAE